MASKADIFENQQAINENIKKVGINIKKDSSERKTSDYFKRRMQMLKQFWGEFQYNHDRLSMEGDTNHPYFNNDFFNITYQVYTEFKEFVIQQHEQLTKQTQFLRDSTSQKIAVQEKKQEGSLSSSEQEQKKQQNKEEDENNQGQSSNSGQPPSQQQQQSTLKADKACNSKLDDMLRK